MKTLGNPRLKMHLVITALSLFVSACGKKEPTDLVSFSVKGVVTSVNFQQHRIFVDHEEIPGYMRAMTMPFKVKDSTLLNRVQPGDTIQATLVVSRTESWLETIAVVSKGETPVPASTAVDAIFRRIFKVGETIPDFSFVNQNDRRIKLSDYRGKVVAITFIYTRCPLPDFCIRMSGNFARVQKTLSSDPLLRGKWHLITISFDPEFDSPEVLKNYSGVYTHDLATWDFVTDSMKTVMEIADGLELVTEDDEGGLIAHNLRTAVIDQKGALVDVFKGNEWTPKDLEDVIVRSIRGENKGMAR